MKDTHVVISSKLYESAKRNFPQEYFKLLFGFEADFVGGDFIVNIDKFNRHEVSTIVSSIKKDNLWVRPVYPMLMFILVVIIIYMIPMFNMLSTTSQMHVLISLFVVMFQIVMCINFVRMFRKFNAMDVLQELLHISNRRLTKILFTNLLENEVADEDTIK